MAWRARKQPIITGDEGMIGKVGKIDYYKKEAWILIDGERWRAISSEPLTQNDHVTIVEMKGLTAIVKKII